MRSAWWKAMLFVPNPCLTEPDLRFSAHGSPP
jgi:hypothetical protein